MICNIIFTLKRTIYSLKMDKNICPLIVLSFSLNATIFLYAFKVKLCDSIVLYTILLIYYL